MVIEPLSRSVLAFVQVADGFFNDPEVDCHLAGRSTQFQACISDDPEYMRVLVGVLTDIF